MKKSSPETQETLELWMELCEVTYRLAIGSFESIAAVPEEKLKALRRHWEEIFRGKRSWKDPQFIFLKGVSIRINQTTENVEIAMRPTTTLRCTEQELMEIMVSAGFRVIKNQESRWWVVRKI